MCPVISTSGLPVTVPDDLRCLLQTHLNKSLAEQPDLTALTLNFRDPDYSAEDGGFHPVEVRLVKSGADWEISYITDFAYVGLGYFAELAKELDFDFGCQQYTHSLFGDIPSDELAELFSLWADNFMQFTQMDIFTINASFD
jgi:hypothetical protein